MIAGRSAGARAGLRALRGARIAAPLAALLFASPAPARADDTESASAFFRAGTAAFARKDYRAAAQSFEAAFAAAPAGGARYNAGLAWESAGEPARAADAFAAAIEMGGLSEASAGDARDRLARLEMRLGRVQVVANGGKVTVAHVRGAPAPTTIHLAPGRYALEVAFEGGELRSEEVEARAGVLERVDVRAPTPHPAATGGQPRHAEAARLPTAARDSDAGDTLRLAGWIGIGAGAVSAGVGLAVGAAGLSARNDYDAGGRVDPDLHDRAVTLRTWTNVALVSGAVLGGVGVVLVLTAPRTPRTSAPATGQTPAAWIGARPGGATLAGRF